jgi:Domain of unknown function (DUF3597)
MSIFGSIMSKIFGHSSAAATTGAAQPSGATAATGQPGGSPAAATGAQAPQQSVDVGAVLTELASKTPQKLNWRQSIVDLMKLLDLDSSLEARKQLAQELHYSGDTNDSASMNIWLHKQVMQKLAENGGKVPAELRG